MDGGKVEYSGRGKNEQKSRRGNVCEEVGSIYLLRTPPNNFFFLFQQNSTKTKQKQQNKQKQKNNKIYKTNQKSKKQEETRAYIIIYLFIYWM